MQHARWLFFDLVRKHAYQRGSGDPMPNPTAGRLTQAIWQALFGRGCGFRFALVEASREFAPQLITRAIEKLTNDPQCRKLIEAEARYPKELESPYDGAEQTLRALSSRYLIGVIANQSGGTEERLAKWGLMPFISICLSSTEVGLEKPDPAIFKLALSQAGCTASQAVMIGDRLDNDIRPARLQGWKTIRIAQGFARFQSPRDRLDEADLTVAHVKLLVPVFMGGL
jgi:HAD superfamily hydrolase (TIGR01549 family)